MIHLLRSLEEGATIPIFYYFEDWGRVTIKTDAHKWDEEG